MHLLVLLGELQLRISRIREEGAVQGYIIRTRSMRLSLEVHITQTDNLRRDIHVLPLQVLGEHFDGMTAESQIIHLCKPSGRAVHMTHTAAHLQVDIILVAMELQTVHLQQGVVARTGDSKLHGVGKRLQHRLEAGYVTWRDR